jgi:hypothetical protein
MTRWVLSFGFALFCHASAFAQANMTLRETPKPADSLVDSIGVNIHMTYGNTAYADVPAVKRALSTLRVRHVRDAGKYYPNDANYNEREFATYGAIGSLGIGFDLILDYNGGGNPNPMTPAVMAALQNLAIRHGVTVEAYEGPNEPNLSGIVNWVAGTRSFMQSVYSSAKATSSTATIPTIGPSLAGPPQDWTFLGDMTALEDCGNLHPYANTQHPSFNFDADLSNQRKVSGSQTIYITEAGWSNATNATDNSPNVTEDVAGRYMGRLFLETLLRGWPRTYVYELLDEQPDSGLANAQKHYGLFRNDYSAKPAAAAVANMITLLSDQGFALSPTSLSYSLSTTSAAVHHQLFQKHDGSYWLALWQEVSGWSGMNGQGTAIRNPDVSVKLTLPAIAPAIQTYRPHDSTTAVDTFTTQKSVTLTVPDQPLFVKFSLVPAPSNLAASVR